MTTIITRAGKGSPLTNSEMDQNLINLNDFKLETSAIGTTVQPYSPDTAKTSTAQTWTADQTFTSMNGGQLAGLRNKVINGDFRINQRNFVSGTVVANGAYLFDRWKNTQATGSPGFTFTTVNGKTIVTIPSDKTLVQIIEGLNIQSATYVLSWEGTAKGRINGGAYGDSGEVSATLMGGVDVTIDFNAGTVSNVQLEIGTVATPFESLPLGLELLLCQRYYQVGSIRSAGARAATSSGGWNARDVSLSPPMRATPSVSLVNVTYVNCSAAVGQATPSVLNISVTAASGASFTLSGGEYLASAEL